MGDRASRKERDRGQRDARPVVGPSARRALIGARTDVVSKEPVILIEMADLKEPQEAPGKSALQVSLQQRRFGGLGVITRRRGCCGKRSGAGTLPDPVEDPGFVENLTCQPAVLIPIDEEQVRPNIPHGIERRHRPVHRRCSPKAVPILSTGNQMSSQDSLGVRPIETIRPIRPRSLIGLRHQQQDT